MSTAPILSRRDAAGAESARGLLLTLLGEFVLPSGGSAWTSAVIDALGRLGVEQKATRQALMRTAGAGWLTSERVGRRTSWRLTPAAERLLTEGTERIYGFTPGLADWDGRWLLVLARAPETDRPLRHLLKTRLTWAGLGSPAPGVWVSTRVDRVGEVEKVLGEAGVLEGAHVFVAEHTGHGDLAAMVAQAWDLSAVEDGYRQFLDDFAAAGAADPLVRLVELVHAWRRFPSLDPSLPDALLPAQWSGTVAATLFRRRHASWSVRARTEWTRLNEAGA
ncbi:MAG TPA: PaaX family transcriptional regulator C-terminal domain-containing protein [Mycobacteriales bacterium]|jgi:phenylacetic acid degradation operon negative regulatory protein|nr:PaaX family transcriptional regulator C-terminal domain-containing protein [Mycobacteriales bacterium]